jgi:hypothetical protein
VLAAYQYYWKSDSLSFRDNRSEAEFTVDKMARAHHPGLSWGVVDQLQHWQRPLAPRWSSFVCGRRIRGPPHEKILRAIRLFGDKVIPKLA